MSESDLIEVAIGGSTAALERSEHLWRLAPDPPDTNDPDEYQHHTETALMGRAIADLLSAGHIQTAHLGPLTAHMDALREGTNCEETAQGAEPVAFRAAAFHALNHTAVGARRANAATMPTTRQILPPGFLQRDPRRGRRDDGGTCMERAVASVASPPHPHSDDLDSHPLIQIIEQCDSLVTPEATAQRTGLGTVIGADLGFCATMHDTAALCDNSLLTATVVLSKAHASPPDSEPFRIWLNDNIGFAADESYHSVHRTAVGCHKLASLVGVLDAVVYNDPGSATAVAVTDAASRHQPAELHAAVREWLSWGTHTPNDLLAPFAAHPELLSRLETAATAALEADRTDDLHVDEMFRERLAQQAALIAERRSAEQRHAAETFEKYGVGPNQLRRTTSGIGTLRTR